MGLLDRAIKSGISKGLSDGISKGLGQAVGKAAEKVIAPKAEAYANAAAKELDAATQAMNQSAEELAAAVQQADAELTQARPAAEAAVKNAGGLAGLESALNIWAQSAQEFANEAAMNMKLCPNCDTAAPADRKFCPKCGTQLPEETLGQGVLCSKCGKQNIVGTTFCTECGTKLPATVAQEKAVLAQWTQVLPQYPVWSHGGTDFRIEQNGEFYEFVTVLENHTVAMTALDSYRETLQQNGFCQAGQYPCKEHLYKMINGSCYHVDTEHCFDGDPNVISLSFGIEEPQGGFDYVKPDPRPQTKFGLGDLKDGLQDGLKGGIKGFLKR